MSHKWALGATSRGGEKDTELCMHVIVNYTTANAF